jgi:hypothetical protein
MERRKEKKEMVKNQINSAISNVWLAFFIAVLVFVASVFVIAFTFEAAIMFLIITPGISTMSGLALFTTGKVCRFKPFVYGAFVFWVGAVVCAFIPMIWHLQSLQFIVLSLCMLTGFVIPGHILNRSADRDV